MGEVNTMEIVTPPTTPNAKGTGKRVSPTNVNTSKASHEGKNENSRTKFLGQYFVTKGKHTFVLAEVIPEPPKVDSSNTDESWRGFRHPKDPSATQQTKWDGNDKWSSRKNWKQKRTEFDTRFFLVYFVSFCILLSLLTQ